MTKTATPLDQKIECPRCRTNTMRKAHPEKIDMEYFCDTCHFYFGIFELVTEWGYDVADFYAGGTTQISNTDQYLTIVQMVEEMEKARENAAKFYFDEETLDDAIMELLEDAEGEWDSAQEREEAYLVVTHMLLGINEWAGYTENVSLDLPCPICQVGMC